MRQAQAAIRPSRHTVQRIRHLAPTSTAETTTHRQKVQVKAHLKGENDL
jgi:hypothetical protein